MVVMRLLFECHQQTGTNKQGYQSKSKESDFAHAVPLDVVIKWERNRVRTHGIAEKLMGTSMNRSTRQMALSGGHAGNSSSV